MKKSIVLFCLIITAPAFGQNPLLLRDVFPGTTGSNIFEIVKTGTYSFFNADDADADTDRGLFRTDGTAAGTIRLNLTDTGSLSTSASQLTPFGNKIIFAGDNLTFFGEIWVSDGTQAGTRNIQTISTAPNSATRNVVMGIAALDTVVLYATRTTASNRFVLRKTKGLSKADTTLVYDFGNFSNFNSNISALKAVNNILYFILTNAATGIDQLWRSDGTTAGTFLVKDFGSGLSVGSFLMQAGSTFYLILNTTGTGAVLWKSDGTAANTVSVKTIGPSPNNNYPPNAAIGNTLYFSGYDDTNGTEVWLTNGTAAATFRVTDINAGTASSTPSQLTALNGTLYFAATNTSSGREMWKYNDSTLAIVKDINAGSTGSFPSFFAVVNNAILFRADDGVNGSELWGTDGTAANTKLLADINPGSASSTPTYLTNGNPVYFSAFRNDIGIEIFKYNFNGSFSTVTPTRLYVNDGSVAGDIFTSAIGSNSNGGTPAAPFASINYAVSVANAGDTIYADAGNFTEQVTINKAVTILGAGSSKTNVVAPSTPLASPAGNAETGIIQSNKDLGNITIRNLAVDGSNGNEQHGIFIQGLATITNCEIKNSNNGLFIRDSAGGTSHTVFIFDNFIHDVAYQAINIQGPSINAQVFRNKLDITTAIFGIGISTGTDFGPINFLSAFGNEFIGYNGFGISCNSNTASFTNANSFTGITGKAIINAGTTAISATCNWYGSADANVVVPQNQGNVTYTPWLVSGMDTSAAIGFASNGLSCLGKQTKYYINDSASTGDQFTTALGSNTNSGISIAPFYTLAQAMSKALVGDTIFVDAGTYSLGGVVTGITKGVTILGTNFNISPNNAANRSLINTARLPESILTNGGFSVNTNNVFLKGLRFNTANFRVINTSNARSNFEFANNYVVRNNTTAGLQTINFTGVNAIGGARATNLRFLNNRIEQADTLFATSILLGGTDTLIVDGNAFVNNSGIPRRVTAMNIQTNNLQRSENVSIINNYIQEAVSSLIITNVGNIRVAGNTIVRSRNGIGALYNTLPMGHIIFEENILTDIGDPSFLNPSVMEVSGTAGSFASAIIRKNTINQNVSVAGIGEANKSMVDLWFGNTGNPGPAIVSENIINITGNYATNTLTKVNCGIQLRGNQRNTTITGNELNFTAINSTPSAAVYPMAPIGIYLETDAGPIYGKLSGSSQINITNNKINGFKSSVGFYDPSAATPAYDSRIGFGFLAGGAVVNINSNSFSGDSISINNGDTSQIINANCNWYGSALPAVVLQKISTKTIRYLPFLVSGTDNSANTGFQPAAGSCASISSFVPAQGQVGASVVIIGFGFSGASAISFNGRPATNFSVLSDTAIQATLPASAATGVIAITTMAGSITSANNFTVIAPLTADTINICPGSNAILRSNILGATYQWQIFTDSGFTNLSNGADYNGVTSDTLRLISVPSSNNGQQYRCRIDGFTPSQTYTLRVMNYWIGGNSTDFSNPFNWGCSGQVPDANTGVVIGSGASVILASPATVNTIQLMPGSEFRVTPGGNLIIKK